jgi:hypothetical protein
MLPVAAAAAAQRAARSREARTADCLLVVDAYVAAAENRVEPFSTNKMKEDGVIGLIHTVPTKHSGGPGARIADRVYIAQDASKPTVVSVDGRLSSSMLPAGLPVIDHLAAWFGSIQVQLKSP